ncbi:MAG: protein kinase [Verrucomicrobiales bacterium]|nr:protein kinase [Verrucomicrobiales bacterium]
MLDVCPACALRRALAAGSGEMAEEGASSLRASALGTSPLGAFGPYELIEEIARGGMGVVYRARQSELNRMVALKRLLFGAHASEAYVKRFRAEAEAAASLRHPNIVAIHEVGVHQGEHFLVMELVDGPPLSRLVQDGPLPPRRAAEYLRSIAAAVQYAHERGLLHRDLKPANVLIDSADQPRITDFGLARRFGADGQPNAEHTQLTVTGQVVGSPGYMPPEQAAGNQAAMGPQSDVYALGAVLYHLLTGRPPFGGGSVAETVHQLMHQDAVAPRLLNPGAPRDLETICLKCLEKEPGRRYATAKELAAELGRFLNGEPTLARPVNLMGRVWRWCRRKPALAGAFSTALALLLILGIGAPVALVRISHEGHRVVAGQRVLRENLYAADMTVVQRAIQAGDLGEARQLLNDYLPRPGEVDLRGFDWRHLSWTSRGDAFASWLGQGWAPQVCFSPDGRWIAGGHSIWEMPMPREVPMEVSAEPALKLPTGHRLLAFAPDGQVLMKTDRKDLKLWNPVTNVESLLLEGETVCAVAFSRSGRWMATGSDLGVRLWEVATWTPLHHQPAAVYLYIHQQGLAIAPDDRWLVTSTGGHFSRAARLQFWTLAGLEALPGPESNVSDVATLAFSLDGTEFYTGSADGSLRTWDTRTRREIEDRRSIRRHRGWISRVVSLPGGFVATSSADRSIVVTGPDPDSHFTRLLGHTSEIWTLAASPDGRTLASGDVEGTVKLFQVTSAVTADQVELYSGTGMRMQALGLSADGHRLATLTDSGLKFWDVSGAPIRELESQRWDYPTEGLRMDPASGEDGTAISPDLRQFAVARSNQPTELWSLKDRTLTRLDRSGPKAFPIFSPDGRHLAGTVDERAVALWDVATGDRRVVIPTPAPVQFAGMSLGFSQDGSVMAVATVEHVLLWNVAQGRERITIATPDPFSVALSPNGEQIAVGYEDNLIRLFDTRTGEALGVPLTGHVECVSALAFSPHGRTLFSGSGEARFYNVATSRTTLTRPCLAALANAFFSRDGQLLVVTELGQRHQIQVWRAPSPANSEEER